MLREAAKWTQDLLAARCQRLGLDITRGILAKIEAAVRGVGDHEVPFLAQALKVSIEKLFPSGLIILKRRVRNPRGARRRK